MSFLMDGGIVRMSQDSVASSGGDSNVDYVLARAEGQMVPLIPTLSCTWARVPRGEKKGRAV